MHSISIYIHWPWCKNICPYCDFNKYKVTNLIKENEMVSAFDKELENFYKLIGKSEVISVFFGGGTPSLMVPKTLKNKKTEYVLLLNNDTEVTLEANPCDVTNEKFLDYKKSGINRISLGIQSFNEHDLKFLGRDHDAATALKSLEVCNSIFDNVSFDLMNGLPKSTANKWKKNLEFASSLVTNHISIYQLTIEEKTKFFNLYKNKIFSLPSEKALYEIFNLTKEILTKKEIFQYEISNYAYKGSECIHNQAIWKYRNYIGIGPGAHSRLKVANKINAISMYKNPISWINKIKEKGTAVEIKKTINKKDIVKELIMVGMRISDGIDLFKAKETLNDNLIKYLNKESLDFLLKKNFIKLSQNKLSATTKGFSVLNTIIYMLLFNNN